MHCNWGVLGPGFIATRAVIPAIQQVPKSRVLAVASNNEERSRVAALRYGIERAYHGYQALLDDPDVDAVYIALPQSPAPRVDDSRSPGWKAGII